MATLTGPWFWFELPWLWTFTPDNSPSLPGPFRLPFSPRLDSLAERNELPAEGLFLIDRHRLGVRGINVQLPEDVPGNGSVQVGEVGKERVVLGPIAVTG